MSTSLKEIKQAYYTELELPGFDPEKTIAVKARRPSILRLAQDGTIPNPLLDAAAQLFESGPVKSIKSGSALKSMGELLILMAKSCLVSPTYDELEQAGIILTDTQLLAIYNYAVSGVRALERFR